MGKRPKKKTLLEKAGPTGWVARLRGWAGDDALRRALAVRVRIAVEEAARRGEARAHVTVERDRAAELGELLVEVCGFAGGEYEPGAAQAGWWVVVGGYKIG